MISVSLAASMEPQLQRKFRTTPVTMPQLIGNMLSSVWSPIIWRGGTRKRSAYVSCDWIALDFDDGVWSLDDAVSYLKDNNFTGVVGTTKSHQKEKSQPSGTVLPACDRFRVVIPASSTLSSVEIYEENMRRIMEHVPVDKSCKDGARFFYPCKEIVHLQFGEPYPVDVSIQMQAEIQERQSKIEVASAKETESIEKGLLPGWIIQSIMGEYPAGGRHKICYRIGATLGKANWSIDDIVYLFRKSKLREIGTADLRRAIENGWYTSKSRGRKNLADEKTYQEIQNLG